MLEDDGLRQKAEARISGCQEIPDPVTPEEAQKIIHELQVHQLELEMQNEELRQAQLILEESRSRYADLYDFAPVGYLTLDRSGIIQEANLTAATQLGVNRGRLINSPLQVYLDSQDWKSWLAHLNKVFTEPGRQIFEGRFNRQAGGQFFASLEGTVIEDAGGNKIFRTAITDITPRQQAEAKLKNYHNQLERLVEARTTALVQANAQLQDEIVERRQAERALQESESRLRHLYETVQAGVLLQRADGVILHANQVAGEIFGLDLREIAGRTSSDPNWHMVLEDGAPVPGDEHPSMITIRTGKPIRNAVRGVFAHDPEKIRWLLINTQPIFDPQTEKLREVTITFQDITALKQTQDALEESLSLYQAAMESTADGLVVVNLDGRIVSWNRKFIDMWDVPEEVINSRDINRFRSFTMDQIQEPQSFLDRITELFEDTTLEYRDLIHCKDGRIFERYSIPQFLDRRIVGRVESFRDITARFCAEQSLRHSEASLNSIIENSPYAMWIADSQGTLIRLNQAFRTLLHINDVDVVGNYNVFRDNIVAEEGVLPLVRQVFDNGQPTRFVLHYDSSRLQHLQLNHSVDVILDVTMSPVLDDLGKVIHVIIQHCDITAQVQAETALKESEARYRTIVETASEGILAVDQDFCTTYVNRHMADMLGYSPAEMLGRPVMDFMFPADLPDHQVKMAQRRQGLGDNYERRFQRRDGSELWAIVAVRPLMDAAGNFQGSFAMFTDITERKRAERERLEHLRFVESLDQINRALQKTNDLEETMEEVLGSVLAMFACDRAYLVYPCDPEASTWRVAKEKTRPEYPGAFATGGDYPLTPEVFRMYEMLLEAPGPVSFGSGAEQQPLPSEDAQRFCLQAMLNMAVYPKVSQPYMFGLHQCSSPRDWTPAEIQLFQEIGNRLADVLTVMLMYRNLKESREKYRLLVSQIPAVVYKGYPDWSGDFFDDKIETLTGYPKADFESRTVKWCDLIIPEDFPNVEAVFNEAAKDNRSYNLEYRIRRQDGEIRWIQDMSRFFCATDGTFPYINGLLFDITVRKLLEESLRQSEEKFRMVADFTYNWETWIGPDNKPVYVSPSCRRITGYTVEEFMANPRLLEEITHPDDRGLIKNHFQHIPQLDRDIHEMEFRILSREGEERWISHNCVPVHRPDGTFLGRRASNREVTKRKQGEQALEESARFIRNSFDSLSSHLAVLDGRGEIIYVNSAWEDFALQNGLNESLLGQNYLKICDAAKGDWSEEAPQVAAGIRSLLAGEIDSFSLEYPCHSPDEERFFVIRATRFRGEGPVRAVVAHENITARKQAEQALLRKHRELQETMTTLEQSRNMLQLIIESIPVRVFWKDKDSRYLGCNTLFARDAGLNQPEQLLGRDDTVMGWREQADLYRADDREVMESGRSKINIVEPQTTPAGDKIWLNTSKVPLQMPTGEVLGVLGVYEDITPRKQAEAALRESEARYRALMETADDAIILADVETGKILEVNKKAASLVGRSHSEIVGQLHTFLHPSSDEAYYRQHFVKLVRRGGGAVGKIMYVQHQDGRRIPVEISTGLSELAGRQVVWGIFRDITERLRLEEEKTGLEAQLFQAQKLEALGTLAGGIAHDFNNILWAIMGFTELTLPSLPEGSKERWNIQQVLQASERARDLVAQILAFSRKANQEKKPLQIALIVKEAIKLLRATIPTTIEIKQTISAPEALVLADPTQLHQIIMNLCTNAAQAMRETGDTVQIGLEEEYLDQESLLGHLELLPGPYVKLTVRDNGPGIAPEIIDNIFDPFFTTKAVGEGTGMGLAVVYGIVKSHGGAIAVSSRPGEGAAFTVLLPKIINRESEDQKSQTSIPRGHGHILVIDDEEMLVLLNKRMLESLGYEVTTATSTLEAIEIFQAQPDKFALVITDQTMPRMDGMQLSLEFRHIQPDIPIILCTGFSEKVSKETVRAAGINALLLKPINLHELGEMVSKVLNKEKQ